MIVYIIVFPNCIVKEIMLLLTYSSSYLLIYTVFMKNNVVIDEIPCLNKVFTSLHFSPLTGIQYIEVYFIYT